MIKLKQLKCSCIGCNNLVEINTVQWGLWCYCPLHHQELLDQCKLDSISGSNVINCLDFDLEYE